MDPPNAPISVSVQQPELGLGDEVDHFVIGQEVTGVEVGSPGPVPDDDLAQGEILQDVVVPDDQPALNPVHLVVEDCSVRLQHPEHLGETEALPLHVGVVGHIVAVAVVAVPAAGSVARGIEQVVGRRSNDQVDGLVGELLHELQAVALVYSVKPLR